MTIDIPTLDPAVFVRPEVAALTPYALELQSCRFKLDQNEMPWDLPRTVKAAILGRLSAARFADYPDFHADALRATLGRYHGHPTAGVLVGNGSNELLGVVLDALAGPGREVLGLAPGFALYRRMVERSGARARFFGPSADLMLPVEELERAIEADPTRPVMLCSPNNPTGEALSVAQVEGLLERLRAPLLLDNAYGEFCRHDYRPLLARHRHLVLFRTFSKAWSLAGIRLGYLLADPVLVEQLIKVKLPYNVGHAGIASGLEVLAAAPVLERRVRLLTARRAGWQAMLTARGFRVLPSEANFLLALTPNADADGVYRGLAARGILVRNVASGPGLAGHLRFSLGAGAALRATAAALDAILGGSR